MALKNDIKLMERVEYSIAENKGKLLYHLQKWEEIALALGYSILSEKFIDG